MPHRPAPRRPRRSPLLRLPERRLARRLAMGAPAGRAGRIEGFAEGDVTRLLGDETFRAIVEAYRGLYELPHGEALLRRARPATAAPAIEHFGEIEVNRMARVVKRRGQPVALTPKEFDLLIALMDRAGAVVPRSELLSAVWGYQADVNTRTVDLHVSELRAKIEPTPAQPVHIITVWKTGYRFEG